MPGMITRRQIGELKQRLKSEELSKESRILEEIREFFKIKERLFEFSPNVGGCCSVFSLSGELLRQVEVLEWVLQALKQNNRRDAVSKLEWFEENCILPEDEEEVKKLEAELGESPEVDEISRSLNLERLLYEKSQSGLFFPDHK